MSAPVPLLDPRRTHEPIREELIETFTRVLDSGRFILGEEVTAFESEVAQYLGVKHAIGVSSGTDALLVALMALDIGPGDEVICPTYTFFATAGSVWRTGAKPVFVDSVAASFNCKVEEISRRITDKTKAIIPVHLFGQCADMTALLEVAKRAGVPVIEDAAQAIGAEHKSTRAGAMGDFGCFSFFPAKNLGALGDGGLVTTNDDGLAELVRQLRTHGGQDKYENHRVGGNFRIDALQAALLRVKLRHLDTYTEGRQRHAKMYAQAFGDAGIADTLPHPDAVNSMTAKSDALLHLPVEVNNRHVYNQYVVRLGDASKRDALRAHLQELGIGCAVYYPTPLHLQRCFSSLDYKEGDMPVAEACSRDSLALPIAAELTDGEHARVVRTVIDFLKK